jgi:N-acetylglucosamine kinase-like BadF-type ATPase
VTSFLGALGGEPGVVLAVGTGAVAIGSDLAGQWRRVDGWGHLVGDLGGGAWIGRAGLVAALRAHDGRRHGSPPLLAELRRQYTDPAALIAGLHDRDDCAARLASFAPAVLAAAGAGDPAAAAIQAEACRHLADTAVAARIHGPGRVAMATVGALLDAHDRFRAGVLAELPADLDVRPAAGTACDGALRLARAAATGELPAGVLELASLHFPARGRGRAATG